MNTILLNTIKKFEPNQITDLRKSHLHIVIDFLQGQLDKSEPVSLNFICVHNSRRSHLCQIWAQVAAHYCKVPNIQCYSGGTEATAMFPMVAKTLESQGFEIIQLSANHNPVYAIKFDQNSSPIISFSKKYDSQYNPKSNFAAILNCSEADGACPIIDGAITRISLTYTDPKISDNTDLQGKTYLERSIQIGTEMLYIFSKLKKG